MANDLDNYMIDQQSGVSAAPVEPVQQIDLNPPPGEDTSNQINLESNDKLPPKRQVAEQRAFKTMVGIGSVLNKPYKDIHNEIASGREQDLREEAASNMNEQNAADRQNKIRAILTGGNQVDKQELDTLLDPTSIANQKVDPSSVIEQGFGHAVVNTLDETAQRTNNPVWKEATSTVPSFVKSAMGAGSEITAYREFALTLAQDVDREFEEEPTLDKGIDMAKSFIPFYSDYKLRGQVKGTGEFSGGLLGSNKELQASQLLSLPFDQYKKQLTEIVNNLKVDNPLAAKDFLKAVMGQSSSEVFSSNIGNILDASSVLPIGTAVKAVRSINRARQAVRDVVEAANVPEITKAAMANAAGDAKEAAVHQTISELINDVKGTADPESRAWNQLTSNMNLITSRMRQNAGRFGQEGTNRLIEHINAVNSDVFKRIQSTSKVDRIPELKASDEVMREVFDEAKLDYRGKDNMLMDTKLVWDRLANRYLLEHQIGQPSGEFFSSPEQAEAAGKLNGYKISPPSDRANKLDVEISNLREQLREPPAMDADTNELNRYYDMEKRLGEAQAEREDIRTGNVGGYEVRQNGLGWYISRMVPLNEYSPVIWDNLADKAASKVYTEGDKYFQPGMFRTLAGRARTPDEVLSPAENAQRKIATHAPTVLEGEFKKASSPIEELPKRFWPEFERTLNANKKMIDPRTGLNGHFFDSPGDLDTFYYTNFHRYPDEAEYKAYFSYVANYERERWLTDLAVMRNKSKLGVENHRLVSTGPDGKPIKSDYFSAAKQRDFPGGNQNDVILFHTDRFGPKNQFRIARVGQVLPNKLNQKVRDAVKKGEVDVLRVYDPELKELKGFGNIGDERVRYIITDHYESKPLEYGAQVNRREGGHYEYKNQKYIKQAKIERETVGGKEVVHYDGDTTAFAAPPVDAEANELVEHLNKVREFIRDNRLQEAEDYNNTHFAYNWASHYGHYLDGHFDPNEPFMLVPKNVPIIKMAKDALESRYVETDPVTLKPRTILQDSTSTGSDARQFQVAYTKERDVKELGIFNKTQTGTQALPVFSYEPAPFLDPITTYNRALVRMIHTFYMDDMKDYSIRHWVEQAAPYLKQKIEELRSAPFRHFIDPDWKSDNQVDPVIKFNLKTAHQMIEHFIGTPSKLESWMDKAKSDVIDSIYGKTGKSKILDNVGLTKSRNPLDLIRNFTFHDKLGLFSIPSFFTQLMTHSNIFGIAGLRPAAAGTMGTLLHTWARVNGSEEFLDSLDRYASKFGIPGTDMYRFKPGQWKEAHDLLINKFGLQNVGGEHAFLDSPFYAKMVQNYGRTFLDWGETFFREGASLTRQSAFYTSYLEWRAKNPIAAIDRAAEEKILARATLLDHNMSRASSSVLHTGIMAPAGQFMAYSLRLMELFTGKRLTTVEKARLFATSSMLYGIPLGGIGLLGFPIADYLRAKAKEQGWLVHDNFFKDVVMEGLPATLLAVLTSKDYNPAHGNWYNFSKWGPESYQVITNALNSDSTIWKILGGAGGGLIYDMISDLNPIWRWGTDFMYPENARTVLTADDLLAPLKNVSSVNQWTRFYQAANTGRWLSKKGTYLTDTSWPSALFMTATGLQPTGVSDISGTIRSIQEEEQNYKDTASEFRHLIQKELQAVDDHNFDQAEAYHKNAMALLIRNGYPAEKIHSLVSTAINDNKSLVERLDESYFLRNVPPEEKEFRMRIYLRQQELKREGEQ